MSGFRRILHHFELQKSNILKVLAVSVQWVSSECPVSVLTGKSECAHCQWAHSLLQVSTLTCKSGAQSEPILITFCILSLKNELQNRARFPTLFSQFFGASLGGPTRNPLQPFVMTEFAGVFGVPPWPPPGGGPLSGLSSDSPPIAHVGEYRLLKSYHQNSNAIV